jgi:hypothetical protein
MNDQARPDRTELPLDVLDQIDRICDRFEAAWTSGQTPQVEDYLGEVAEVYRSALLAALLAAELDARRRRGESPEPREYTWRFPSDPATIASAFASMPIPHPHPKAPPQAAAAPDTGRDLLFGLIALQNGLIDPDQLVGAFRAWTRDKARPLADYLAERGALDADDRQAVEALVARHLKKHGGRAERSLAAIPTGRSTRESLAQLGDPDLAGPWPISARPRPGRRLTPTAPPATRWARPPATASGSGCCGRMPGAGWAPSSWRWTPSCIARWRSSRSSISTPTTRSAAPGS